MPCNKQNSAEDRDLNLPADLLRGTQAEGQCSVIHWGCVPMCTDLDQQPYLKYPFSPFPPGMLGELPTVSSANLATPSDPASSPLPYAIPVLPEVLFIDLGFLTFHFTESTISTESRLEVKQTWKSRNRLGVDLLAYEVREALNFMPLLHQ